MLDICLCHFLSIKIRSIIDLHTLYIDIDFLYIRLTILQYYILYYGYTADNISRVIDSDNEDNEDVHHLFVGVVAT